MTQHDDANYLVYLLDEQVPSPKQLSMTVFVESATPISFQTTLANENDKEQFRARLIQALEEFGAGIVVHCLTDNIRYGLALRGELAGHAGWAPVPPEELQESFQRDGNTDAAIAEVEGSRYGHFGKFLVADGVVTAPPGEDVERIVDSAAGPENVAVPDAGGTNLIVPWYETEEDWEDALGVSVDWHNFYASYDEWLYEMEDYIEQQIVDGVQKVQKVPVDVDELVAWAEDAGFAVDSEVRGIYALRKAQGLLPPTSDE